MNFYEKIKTEETKNKYPEIIKIIEDFLMNNRCRIEGQRISEKTFKKYNQNWEIFEQNKITNSQDLYNFIMDETPICPKCNKNERRWASIKDGYKKYCEGCSRTINWITNTTNYTDNIPLNEILEYVKDSKGNYNTSKIKKLHENTIKELKNNKSFITWDASLSEYIYCLEHEINSINDLPKCLSCQRPVTRFYASTKGYWNYHQGECANIKRINECSENTKMKIREHRSTTVYKRMDKIPKNHIRLKDFDKETYLETGTDYVTLECSKGHTYNIDNHYQGSFRCGICFPKRSKIQNDIFEFLRSYDNALMNDTRQVIKPLEIDIFSLKNKFGIEYDSQNYHSSGVSEYLKDKDKNYHLMKTELMEEKDYQLFHIFSSEYLNETKKQIWNSMLLNKMNISEKIYARKCFIKEITSSEARIFCETNHIQGYVNSSIRVGLFYNEQLVQVMTFGKPRQGKYKDSNNYELLRMCSLLNHVVIGGASKLLKYFERTYNPELILSYANRRWAYKDNVYPKLGFELDSITPPNYFYFLPKDECELESRVKYQKHKLKNYPEYSDDLTETEIMFKRGYRKIYDCGNYVYLKKI